MTDEELGIRQRIREEDYPPDGLEHPRFADAFWGVLGDAESLLKLLDAERAKVKRLEKEFIDAREVLLGIAEVDAGSKPTCPKCEIVEQEAEDCLRRIKI